jgi:hypothetical protein
MASSDQTPWLASLALGRGSGDVSLPFLDAAAPVVASHPLRITHRDQLREDDLEAWWDSFQLYKLHVRVGAPAAPPVEGPHHNTCHLTTPTCNNPTASAAAMPAQLQVGEDRPSCAGRRSTTCS